MTSQPDQQPTEGTNDHSSHRRRGLGMLVHALGEIPGGLRNAPSVEAA